MLQKFIKFFKTVKFIDGLHPTELAKDFYDAFRSIENLAVKRRQRRRRR